jgi:hypothetical protein
MPANPTLDYSLPQLRTAERRLRMLAQQMGISYALAQYGGMRTQADTTQILGYRINDYRAAIKKNPNVARIPIDTWRPIAPFGRSLHNWGAAFDIIITAAPPGWTASKALAALGAFAPQAGLRWGGTFSSDRLDPPHFELPMSVVDARAAYLQFTNGKGYQGPSGPLDFLRGLFGSRPAPIVEVQEARPVVPGVSYIRERQPVFDTSGLVAAPLPIIKVPERVNADDAEEERPRDNRIGTNARYSDQPTMMLAGDDNLGSAVQSPVRTDVTDAALFASAQEAKRKRDLQFTIALVVAGAVILKVVTSKRRKKTRRRKRRS